MVSPTVTAVIVPPELATAFAQALDYPHEKPLDAVTACATLSRPVSDEAADLLDRFAEAVAEAPLGDLQEAYTRTFDLDTMSQAEPTCYPYVGHYLFEENHKRGAFILGLRRRFRAQGFEEGGGELPDHLVVLLRFLPECEDAELAEELVDDAMLPALAKMLVGDDRGGSLRGGYRRVLRALELTLRGLRPEAEPDPGEVESEREWLRPGDSLGIERDGHGH